MVLTRPLLSVGIPGIEGKARTVKSASQQVAPIVERWDLLARFHGSLARQEALGERGSTECSVV